jgi:hypothetical protein
MPLRQNNLDQDLNSNPDTKSMSKPDTEKIISDPQHRSADWCNFSYGKSDVFTLSLIFRIRKSDILKFERSKNILS